LRDNIRQTELNLPGDISEILAIFCANLRNVFGDQLIGVYLTGSLTYDGFDRGSSDIDLLVVLRSAFSTEQREQVKNIHARIVENHPLWTKRIECSYITEDMLQCEEPPVMSRPYVNGGQMWDPDPPYGNEWLLNLYVLYECGLALFGPTPKLLIGHPIHLAAVREASKKDLHQEWKQLLKDSSALKDSHFQAYAILTLCRILYRAKNDNIASKRIASAWVKKLYGKPWSDLIEKAEDWQYGQEMDSIHETLRFIQFVLQELG
jgi:hypothetical protein